MQSHTNLCGQLLMAGELGPEVISELQKVEKLRTPCLLSLVYSLTVLRKGNCSWPEAAGVNVLAGLILPSLLDKNVINVK